MLLTLLSQVTPTLDITPANVLSALALLFAVVAYFRKENREDGQTVAQRLKKAEGKLAEHDQLHTGQVQARELLASDLMRDHKALKEALERRCADLEQKVNEVPPLRERIASMEAKLDRIPEMDRKLDRLHEMLGHLGGK